jgi:hypothetical protein
MATMTTADYAALRAGYTESERVSRAGGRAGYINPHPWGSRLHRMFEFGYYVQERGLTLGAQDYWQTGRGGTFTSPAGTTYRLWCDKSGLGIQRAA